MSKNNKVDYSQKILEVDNLKKYFTNGVGKNKLTVPAVDGLTFDIYKREVFGLVGESGCGKTTTGRTIIKLLAPTDGSAKLNGEKVVAGFRQHIERIKEIKVEAKEKILELNPYEAEKTRIERNRDSEVEILKAEIAETKLEMKDAIDQAKHPIGQYKTDKYNAKSAFDADVEKVNYRFHLDNKEIRKKTINEASREYNREFRGAQLGYKRKVEGLKESAALREDVVKNRIRELTEEYEAYYKELEQKYEPLIKESESKIISSDEAKQKISELKKIRDEKIKARKKQYAQEKSAIRKPNKAEIKENISRITAEYKARINDIEKQIVDMKKEAAKKIEQIPESFKTEISKEEMKEKIAKINEWKKEAIHEQKVKVKEAKAANKSQEALEASRKMQMIFQDPISSLNPRMTVQEIVGEGLTIEGGHSKKEIKEKVGEVLELVGLSREYAARYPHEFSGGQRQRIGVARALIMDPDFIIADEPISALDVSIQAQVINLLSELRERLDLTMLFIAHDLSVVQFFCDRIAVMYYGKIVELASSEDLFENPMHPYTRSLLSSIPQPDPDYEKNRVRIAYDPGMHDYLRDKPSLREVKKDHFVYVNDAEFAKLQEELENKKSSKKEKVN